MRRACLLVVIGVPWCCSQLLGAGEMDQLTSLFGTPSSEDLDLTPTHKPTNGPLKEGEISDLETQQRLADLWKATPQPDPPSAAPAAACGWTNAGAQAFRIKDAQGEAQFGEFPWMVAILKRTEGSAVWSQTDFVGGGALIHPRAVLTGAHKVDRSEARELKCRAGEYDTQTEEEQYPHQERNVEKIIKHEGYYRTSVYNSVALLVLAAPFALAGAPHVGAACVARAAPAAGARCLGTGWGKQFGERDKYAVVLKKEPGRYAVFGLVAYGLGCGDETPGVYVNVPYLYDWILEKSRAEGLETSFFTY